MLKINLLIVLFYIKFVADFQSQAPEDKKQFYLKT